MLFQSVPRWHTTNLYIYYIEHELAKAVGIQEVECCAIYATYRSSGAALLDLFLRRLQELAE
jgi:hypothetical protein